MTAQSIQLRKEARQIFWPWLVVTLVGLMCVIRLSNNQYSWGPLDFVLPLDLVLPVGCFLAIPLLAALPLGSEFQHGTLSMLLAQPVDRRALWLRKILITFGAVLPAAILYVFAWHLWQEVGRDFWMAAAWMVATTAGAAAWTLIARSTIGGLALSSGAFWIVFIVWLYVSDRLDENPNYSAALHWMTGILLSGYCAALVWLGRRMFLHFQVADGVLGREALTLLPATRSLPQISWDWLRSRPHGAILNLLRREFHLLRIVWLLSLFSLFIWIALVLFGLVRPNEMEPTPLPAGLAVVLSLVIALLAGALSLGEEKNWRTHSWQLTLPLSASAQWFIKFVFALCTGVFCAVVIPLAVLMTRGWIAGAPFSYLDHTPIWIWFAEALVATSVAFWCSCVVKGTVRAVLFTFPMLFALGLTYAFGNWLGYGVARHSEWLLNTVANKFDPFRVNHSLSIFANQMEDPPWFLPAIIAPLLALGLIQSLRLFRAQTDNRKLHVLRCMLPPLATLCLTSFALSFFFLFTHGLQSQENDVLRETHLAIQKLVAGRSDARQFERLKIDDLARANPLSDRTQHWLRDSTILVTIQGAEGRALSSRIQWPYERANAISGSPGQTVCPYSATIRTAKGSQCILNFWASGQNEHGLLTYACE